MATNTTYEFSGWAKPWPTGNPPRIKCTINGKQVGPSFQLQNSPWQWQNFSAHWNSQTSTSALTELRLETTDLSGNDVAFDDFTFTFSIPKPAIQVSEVEICWASALSSGVSGRMTVPS